MGFLPLLLFLLGITGCIVEGVHEVLETIAGSSISLQCRYEPKDSRGRKVWCRIVSTGCRSLVTSMVDRRAVGSGKAHLTDLGEGLLEVVMDDVQLEDAGEYNCMMDTATGPQVMQTFILKVSLPVSRQEEEEEEEGKKEDYEEETLTLAPMEYPTSSPSFSPVEPNREAWSIPLVWGSVLLLGLLLVAAVVLAVIAGRMGGKLDICGRSQSSETSAWDTRMSAEEPSSVPYEKLGTPPSLDDTTYTNPPLGPPSGKPPPPPPPTTKSEPQVHFSTKPVTYATVVFPSGAEDGETPSQPT
ncbi:trem-like transcript 1 protein [Gracilinanus agilis]|uniref:trem-like transcript 1 protein n=1 Tax=Gracilinanus agilis TaxID=191870 RepID=UPI001CFEE7C8|nr:trem-like transcript 1 protein [Gracilinanus agilis]